MTKLERTEKALAVAEANLKSIASYRGTFGEQANNALKGIADILNPPPEMETVEVKRVGIYHVKTGEFNCSVTEEIASKPSFIKEWPGCVAIPLTGTYQRPKPAPVERFAIVTFCDNGAHGYIADHDVKGKKGVFTYPE